MFNTQLREVMPRVCSKSREDTRNSTSSEPFLSRDGPESIFLLSPLRKLLATLKLILLRREENSCRSSVKKCHSLIIYIIQMNSKHLSEK